jgi:hypothetical protein
MKGSLFCFQHDPEREEERHRAHVKGGRTGGRGRPKGGSELTELKRRLKEVAEGVLSGEIDTRKGAVVAQLLTAYRGVVETEIRVCEQRELEERLADLEQRAGQQQRRRFG